MVFPSLVRGLNRPGIFAWRLVNAKPHGIISVAFLSKESAEGSEPTDIWNRDDFTRRHIGQNPEERNTMVAQLGCEVSFLVFLLSTYCDFLFLKLIFD